MALGLAPVEAAQDDELGLVDRIVAVVDEDPILWSDLDRAMSLGLIPRLPGEDDADYQRRVLDQTVDTRLRFHEVDRFGQEQLPLSEVEAQYREVRGRFADEASFDAELAELGLSPEQLKGLLVRQLMVLSFVEERLGPNVFVSLHDIREYYEEVLTPEMERRGEALPEIGEVREQIRGVLRQQRLNDEIENWTAELRRRADIADYLERQPRELPPVVER